MDCTAISVLTSLITSNATDVLFAGFPNNAQKLMVHLATISLVCLFCSSLSATKLQAAKYEAGAKFFHGLTTLFSAMFVAMISACILPGYFKWFSCLLCLIPVVVHTLSEPRWAFDWLSNAPLLLRCLRRLFR